MERIKKRSTPSSLLLIALLFAGLFFTNASFFKEAKASAVWNIQTISESSSTPSGLTLDTNNNPHIAYTEYNYNNKTNNLVYASWNDSFWIKQTVAADSAFNDLTLDSNNNPHILFLTPNVGLWYAYWTGSEWSIDCVDNNGQQGSLALDSSGNPHVAYFSNSTLKYSSWNGSSWLSETVDADSITYRPSLRIDANDNPHIMYETSHVSYHPYNSSEALKYTTHTNVSGWRGQTVSQSGGFRNMVLDSHGNPHFTVGSNHVSWTGSTWNNQSFSSIFNSSVSFGDSYLTLDKEDYPNICILISTREKMSLSYIRWTGSEWVVQSVDSDSIIKSPGPIAIDTKGDPYICYFKTGSGGAIVPFSLKYTTTAKDTVALNMPFLAGLLLTTAVIIAIAVAVLGKHWKKNQPRRLFQSFLG